MLTIITPTFNRSYILGRLFESLKRQSNVNFEWIIVDDGSTDETEKLVKSWLQEDLPINLKYYKKENGGKHRALNFAIPKAQGKYVFIVDSDDYLVDNAVEYVFKWIDETKNDDALAGIAGLRGYPSGAIIGEHPKFKNYIDINNSLRFRYGLKGDKAEIYRKDILLKYPFPEFENEKFIGESAVWNKIAEDGYKVRWYNQVIYIGEYLNDGLTRNSNELYINNFKGYTYNIKLNYQVLPFPYNYTSVASYIVVAKEKGLSKQEIIENLGLKKCDYYIGKILGKFRGIGR